MGIFLKNHNTIVVCRDCPNKLLWSFLFHRWARGLKKAEEPALGSRERSRSLPFESVPLGLSVCYGPMEGSQRGVWLSWKTRKATSQLILTWAPQSTLYMLTSTNISAGCCLLPLAAFLCSKKKGSTQSPGAQQMEPCICVWRLLRASHSTPSRLQQVAQHSHIIKTQNWHMPLIFQIIFANEF